MMNKKVLYKLLISGCTVFLFSLCTYLFYNMLTGQMHSDLQVHLQNAINGDYYSLMAIILAAVFSIFKTKISIACVLSFVVLLNAFLSAIILKEILGMIGSDAEFSFLYFISIGLLFICKLCIPDISNYFFHNALVTQPWHNSTYLLMRPLAISVLLLFFQIQKHYLHRIETKECIIFTILLFLTNFAKPNFVIAFAPMMLFYLILDFVQTKAKSFRNAFVFGACVLVGCSIMLFQFGILFPGNDGGGISISINNFLDLLIEDRKYVINILMNLAFPLYVLYLVFLHRKEIDSYTKRMFSQSWIMYLLSLFEWFFIRETGIRATHQNFRWGEEFFAYFLFAFSFCILIKLKKENLIDDKKYTIAMYTFVLHVIFGLSYFLLLCFWKYPYLEI